MSPEKKQYRSADGLLVIDVTGRILHANAVARKLLELTDLSIRESRCYDLIDGRNLDGSAFCCKDCPPLQMARKKKPIRSFDWQVRTRSGKIRWFNVTTILKTSGRSKESSPYMIRIIRRSHAPSHIGELSSRHQRFRRRRNLTTVDGFRTRFSLSQREAEILKYLTEGLVPKEMSVRMHISIATVRTHIQNLLAKMGVHSKLEAVALALRE